MGRMAKSDEKLNRDQKTSNENFFHEIVFKKILNSVNRGDQ